MIRILAVARRMALLSFPAFVALAQQPQVTIGMVVDGPGRRPGMSTELIQREIKSLLAGQYDVRFPAAKLLDGKSLIRNWLNMHRLLLKRLYWQRNVLITH